MLNLASDPKEHFNLGLHTSTTPVIGTGLLRALATVHVTKTHMSTPPVVCFHDEMPHDMMTHDMMPHDMMTHDMMTYDMMTHDMMTSLCIRGTDMSSRHLQNAVFPTFTS